MLSDGVDITPPSDGITVFIGPNNAGKSLLLRELCAAIQSHPRGTESPRWVSQVTLRQEGTPEDFIAWLESRGYGPRIGRQGVSFLPSPRNHSDVSTETRSVMAQWQSGNFSGISSFLVADQWTDQRLVDGTSSGFWDNSRPPNHPVQHLWESKEEHAHFSKLVEAAFGIPISINRYVPQIRLQLGAVGVPDTPPPASRELREAYERLPFITEQGDGMRAFVNILVHSLVRPNPVIVIDEPEAFLHPPQARLLGRYLALHVPSPSQVFVATHSADFLSGVLEGNADRQGDSKSRLAVVRISRAGGETTSSLLAPDSVREILDTPLLRYSNIISGLFHDGVVLCEAEGDCQFYAATQDAIRGGRPYDNLIFLHVNGKARLADAAAKLRTCGIPTAVIADFDLLREPSKVRQAVSLLGGDWEDFRDDVTRLQKYASSSVIVTPASEVKKKIIEVIGNPKGGSILGQEQIISILQELKSANAWKVLKSGGLSVLNGDPYNAACRLLKNLADVGVFVVPVGELEHWVRSISSSNKSFWLSSVFDEGLHRAPTVELRGFMSAVGDYFSRDL